MNTTQARTHTTPPLLFSNSFLVVAVARYLYARGGLQLPIQPVPSLEAMVDALLADDGKAAAPSSPPQTPADEPASFMLLLRGIFYVATMVQFDSSSQPLRAVFNRWTNFLATRRKSAAASATATTTAPDLELEGRILRKISVVESHSALASAALTAATNDDDAVRHDLALTVLVDRLESGVVAPSVAFDALLTEFQRLAPRPGAPLTNPRGAVHRRPSLRQSQRLLLLARRLLRSSPHVPPEMLPRFQQAVAPLCMLPVPVGSLARSLLEALQQEVRCPGSLQRLNQTQQQQRIHVVVDLDSGTAAVEAARKLGATQLSTAADQVHVVLSHSADNEDVRLHRLRRAVADRFKVMEIEEKKHEREGGLTCNLNRPSLDWTRR